NRAPLVARCHGGPLSTSSAFGGAAFLARRRAPCDALGNTALPQQRDQAFGLLRVELERPGLLDYLIQEELLPVERLDARPDVGEQGLHPAEPLFRLLDLAFAVIEPVGEWLLELRHALLDEAQVTGATLEIVQGRRERGRAVGGAGERPVELARSLFQLLCDARRLCPQLLCPLQMLGRGIERGLAQLPFVPPCPRL